MRAPESETIHIEQLKPKLSSSVILLSEFDGTADYLVYQKKINAHLKIDKALYDVLKLLDGTKTLRDISEMCGLSLSDLYDSLYKTYKKYGFVETEDSNKLKPKGPPSYLLLSFPILQKKHVLKITRYTSVVFKKQYVVTLISVFSILFFGILYKSDVALLSKETLLTVFNWKFYAMLALSVFIHELGHASAVNFFNREPGHIGGGFYILKPVLYTDVSNIWSINAKKRIIVNLAGIYFELIFSIVLMLYSVLFNNSEVFKITIGIVAISFFNLIPFLRGDGYWVLSDMLKVHNLKKTSESKLIVFIKTLKFTTTKDLVLIVYALINNALLSAFLFFYLVYDYQSIVEFPKLLFGLFSEGQGFFDNLLKIENAKLLIPLMFYILLIRLILKSIKRIFKKSKL